MKAEPQLCRHCGKPKDKHVFSGLFCDNTLLFRFEPSTLPPAENKIEKELTTWVNQDGSIETKLMPKNTGFEIENYEGTFHGFKHILESCFLKINDNDIVKAKMHFQVTKTKETKTPKDVCGNKR